MTVLAVAVVGSVVLFLSFWAVAERSRLVLRGSHDDTSSAGPAGIPRYVVIGVAVVLGMWILAWLVVLVLGIGVLRSV